MNASTLFLQVFILSLGIFSGRAASAQSALTPESFFKIGRVSAVGITKDKKAAVYKVSYPNLEDNSNTTASYRIELGGGEPVKIDDATKQLTNKRISPDGKYSISVKQVKLLPVTGPDYYPDLAKSSAKIYDDLHHRHWDAWEDGNYNHLFLHTLTNGVEDAGADIMEGQKFDSPTVPFGGDEDFTWSPDSKRIVYVCKKKFGKEYVTSTNTDLYSFDVTTGKTENVTEGMMGYDTHPAFNANGDLAWLSMERDGYEADKNRLMVMGKGGRIDLTSQWDGTVSDFKWSDDGKLIYFIAPVDGTKQLFVVDYPGMTKKLPVVKQLSSGDFDVTGIVGQSGNSLVVTRTDMNRATELFIADISSGKLKQLSTVNDAFFAGIPKSKTEKRYVTTTDGKKMLVWVIYPPDFDASKKYPTLLYCQGGPQSALTQFYSYRWNFQLMASQGYVVVAPNRRGMPGHGQAWNEQISKDWGGQVMQDYLSAIDEVSKESWVDKERLGAVGASYGGYSVFYLAGIHNNRFKTFIAHAGVFDLRSMYGTTEEVFFTNFDLGGPYWEKNNEEVVKSYTKFNPSDRVAAWNTPMLVIHGGLDYRVPEGQGFQAYQALQLKGINSRLLYFPDENHWILKHQNALTWQREFFRWLKETL